MLYNSPKGRTISNHFFIHIYQFLSVSAGLILYPPDSPSKLFISFHHIMLAPNTGLSKSSFAHKQQLLKSHSLLPIILQANILVFSNAILVTNMGHMKFLIHKHINLEPHAVVIRLEGRYKLPLVINCFSYITFYISILQYMQVFDDA